MTSKRFLPFSFKRAALGGTVIAAMTARSAVRR